MKLLTAKEVSQALQVTQARVYELARERVIPAVRLGRQIRFDESGLREWITRGGASLTEACVLQEGARDDQRNGRNN